MDSILSTLGLGNRAVNPADYNTSSEIGKQLAAVKSQINGTLNTITAAISGFKLLGVNNNIITTLQGLQTQAQTLVTKVASPAELQKEWANIQSSLVNLQLSAASAKYNDLLNSVRLSYTTVSNRVGQVALDSNITPELLSDYNTLLNDVSGTVLAVLNTNPVTMGSTLPKTVDGIMYYVAPSDITTPAAAADRLYDLDTRYDQLQTGQFNWRRFYTKIYNYIITKFIPLMFIVLIILSMILAGIVSANSNIGDWEGGRIFSFVYGGLLLLPLTIHKALLVFPIYILRGIINPPYWYSYLIPIYKHEAIVTTPTGSGMNGGSTTPPPPDNTSLFTYDLVGSTPTATQTSNKNTLRTLCIIDLILLLGFGSMYGYTVKYQS
jgi:hypothetical protein